jgi:hypothetical protein
MPSTPINDQIAKSQSFLHRDFESIRQDLLDLVRVHYPDQYQDFNSVSVGMSLIDLLAYVSDLLSFYTDKKFNELFIEGVSERTSAFRLAKTFGYKPPGFRAALTLSDITIEVPPTADGPDPSYLPIYRPGVQTKGAAQIFETVNEIDFSSDFSEDGTANRKIEPVFNANQDILRYRITKREKIKAGQAVIFKKEISLEDALTPFFEITLPETNVLEIVSVIVKPGTGLLGNPTFSEFSDLSLKYFEVDDLAEKRVFVNDDTQPTVNGVKSGKYIEVVQRFTKEFMADGSCVLTFGGGTPSNDAYSDYLSKLKIGEENKIKIQDVFDNMALGTKLPSNSTLYVKYRIGGGSQSNVGANTLQQVGNINAVIMGSNPTLNQNVIGSTVSSNVLPAIGGADLPTVDEIRFQIAANFASQKRCVTLEDYLARVSQIPGRFGAPFRTFGKVEDNKVKLYILSKDANGKLISTSTNTIKNNMVEFLIPFRMINDFVEVNDGRVVNISVEADLFVDKTFNSNEVKVNAINTMKEFFDIDKWQMNQNIYVSQIVDKLRDVPGVINVVDVRFFNMEGGGYSNVLLSQATGARESIFGTNTFRTGLEYINNTIFSTAISMFEVRFPERDIKVRIS